MWKEVHSRLDTEKGKRDKVWEEVSKGICNTGMISEEIEKLHWTKDKYGICYNCRFLQACITRYGRTYARCDIFRMSLSGSDPISECTRYMEISFLSLDHMIDIATIIDVDRRQAGFVR